MNIRLLLRIMSIVVGLLLLVVAIASLGMSDRNLRITDKHHDHEADAALSHPHAVALLEQQRISLLADSVSPVDSNNGTDSCNRRCGSVPVPYPFGLSESCARTNHFLLQCLNNLDSGYELEPGPWPFLTTANGTFTPNYSHPEQLHTVNKFQVLDITPGFMIINTTTIKAGACESSGFDWNDVSTYGNATIHLPPDGPLRTSTNNVAFASGCYAKAYSSGLSDQPYVDNYLANGTGVCGPTPCYSSKETSAHDAYAYCNDNDNACTSCTLPFPSSLDVYLLGGGSCGFSSVLYPPTLPPAQSAGNVTTRNYGFGSRTYGLQLEWILTVNERDYPNCSMLIEKMPASGYACTPNASCSYIRHSVPTIEGILNYTGYFCECKLAGYRGDGYINGTGCNDIDECQEPNPCNTEQGAHCTNLGGSYSCSCPGDLVGDGSRNGTGCQKPRKSNTALISGLAAGGVFLFVIVNSLMIWYIYRKRQKNLRNAFFSADFSRRDFLLEIQSKEGANICKLFTYEELQKATDNFSPKMELGTGGFGTVFEGTLDDGTKLAIKKAKHDVGGGHNDTKQFINEVTVLSQVNHRNLVKLLGCCLETAVPVLVYEFISNGNLFEHLRRDQMHMLGGRGVVNGPENKLLPSANIPPLNWDNRLKVAIGTAEALTYLHSGTYPPIYHRDVKTANILLDEKYNAKVADFGLSKFVPVEATHLSTAIQGTPGYLDPEYFDSCQITNKSDVYSFGVVLLELLTAEKPVDLSRQAGDQNLVLRCNRLMKHGRLEDIIDPVLGASSDPKMLAVIHGVASVAMKCVERLREDRPSMGEVLEELQSLRRPGRKDGSGFGKSVLGKSRSCKAVLGNSISSKQVRFEEAIMATPLLQIEGTSSSSEGFYNRSDFSSTALVSSSGSSDSLFTNGSGNVSVELLPR